jgi:NTP pyrophosphatase (non-canonical NTP hydrolase)
MNILERLNKEIGTNDNNSKVIDLGDIKEQLKSIDSYLNVEGKYKEDYSYPIGYIKGIYAVIGELDRKGIKVIMSGLKASRDAMVKIANDLPSRSSQKAISTENLDRLNELLAQKKLKSLEEDKELYKKLIQTYGQTQMIVAIEELSELQKELTKSLRGKNNKESIIEEMADVYIMLEQMKLYYGIDDKAIIDKIEEKNNRTRDRLRKEEL